MPSWRLVFLSLSQTSILGSIPSGGTKNTYTTMTNEDIATKFYDDVESLKGHPCYHHLGTYSDGVYNGALDMAEWKDNQLKQLLSEHMEHATGQRLEAFMDLYRELFEQNAPENPQATRLSTTRPSNCYDALSTPRELCELPLN